MSRKVISFANGPSLTGNHSTCFDCDSDLEVEAHWPCENLSLYGQDVAGPTYQQACVSHSLVQYGMLQGTPSITQKYWVVYRWLLYLHQCVMDWIQVDGFAE